MVGSTVGPVEVQVFCASRDSTEDGAGPSSVEDSVSCLKETDYASPWFGQLGLQHRPRGQTSDISYKEGTIENQEVIPRLFRFNPPLGFKMNLVAFQNRKSYPLNLGVPSHYFNIMTDASGVGWGIKTPHQQFSGTFDQSLIPVDIAVKELLTIL